jgi:ubiquinone/menaquinone biosynthesis C-methylase UbiE
MAEVEWDYSDRAAHYDKRADYSSGALDAAIKAMALEPGQPVADVGAGTGKLSRPLAEHGFRVKSVEPNDEMRKFGIKNTQGLPVTWSDGTGEITGLPDRSFHATFFGSSFNVVDQKRALLECKRILLPRGWFCCMWNHRDLNDPTQSAIEAVIKKHIQNYDYGARRKDPGKIISESGLFNPVKHVEGNFVVNMPRNDTMEAWRSHATLARQAGPMFNKIIEEIEKTIGPKPAMDVPYTTRIWFTQLLN